MQDSSSQSGHEQTPIESLRHALMYLDALWWQLPDALNQIEGDDG